MTTELKQTDQTLTVHSPVGNLSRHMQIDDARMLLDQHVESPVTAVLGPMIERADIKSTIGPFMVLPEYRIQYPEKVTKALGNLYAEYNEAFGPLVAANREWGTDYQYVMTPDGTPINGWVQIDMVGLPDKFLEAAAGHDEEEVRKVLRRSIFEIENSLAMYQLLERIFSYDGRDTLFKQQFRASLGDLRKKYGKPIALLAVTDQKYNAMKASEFGKGAEELLTDEEVRELSGFDRFFGPDDFQKYLAENSGQCDLLLYVRSSDPVAKLKKPDTVVEIPILADDTLRRIIKAHAITFNIDNPVSPVGSPARINDTKEYLLPMGMAYAAYSDGDILSPQLTEHLSQRQPYENFEGDRLSPEFVAYLRSQGVDPARVESGETTLRAKPMKGSYGCYGHISGPLGNKKFRQELRRNVRERGPYVIQPEMSTPVIENLSSSTAYNYIDRVFFSTNGHHYRYMGGFRSLMPIDSIEARNRRNHGSAFTVWAEIN